MIPERYKSKGFNKVGQKKQSTRPGKKWMVLAKKGDSYKIVHGGDDSMQDYKQHGSAERRKNFWNRMGGKNSAKATDPFSPLYWHKRFGTWATGGSPTQERDDFNKYLLGTLQQDPSSPLFNPSYILPDSEFEVSDDIKKQLKENNQEISSIRKYDDNLQYDVTTGTGQYDFSPEFQDFNILAQLTTGIANMAKDAKTRQYENNQYLKALTPQPKYSTSENGLNNIPMYAKGGQNPPKVYTDKKQFEQAQRMYNDSLNLYNKSKKEIGKNGNSSRNTPVYVKKGVNPNEFMLPAYDFVQYQLIDNSGKFQENLNPNNTFPAPKVKQSIMPIGGIGINAGNSMGGWYNIYKKPVQPVSYKPPFTHPIQKMSRLKPISPSLDRDNLSVQPQQLNIPQQPLRQQQGTPIYGPGRTIIGYNNNMQFTPALQYTGAKNNELNLQDKALLDNPEALKQYVSKFENYEFKNGGLTNQKAFEILRAGKTKNGKPLTDAQKKFFFMMGTRKNKKATGGFGNDLLSILNNLLGREDDWHHNVDDIPFPEDPYDTFIGPPTYPVDPTINDTYDLLGQWDSMARPEGEYTFTPVRTDYNKKYVPLGKSNIDRRTTASSTQATPQQVAQTIQQVTPPSSTTTQQLTPEEILALNNKEYADIATKRLEELNKQNKTKYPSKPYIKPNDRFQNNLDRNNKIQTQPTTQQQIDYVKKLMNSAGIKYQDGGLNEGAELDLTESEIQSLIQQGYKIEIL
jgi:hypothetical protein